MRRWLALLLVLGCGGMADAPSHIDVTMALEQPLNWCCEVEQDGFVHLECGSVQKVSAVCYCAGVVDTFSGSCQ